MRRVQLAAAAIAAGVAAVSLLGGRAVAATLALSPSFPASRIQIDPAPATLRMPGPTTVSATVVDWNGKGLPAVPVNFAVISGPSKGKTLAATTDKNGQAHVSYPNAGQPGIDSVQASFSDGLEIHRSNRHFILWQSGPPATAIRSPATITVSPSCFQPAAGAAVTANDFRVPFPASTPKPPLSAATAFIPPPEHGTITVAGENFNPLSDVLITFDAGPGSTKPQSFQTVTDAFGRFIQSAEVIEPGDGLHLIRADDFRQREADFPNYRVPCYQPSLALQPPIGPPGFVTFAVGTGFPPNSAVSFLNWDGRLPSPPTPGLTTDGNGAFHAYVLILYHDELGPRYLIAVVANDQGSGSGAANITTRAPFLVTPGRSQPGDFVLRR
ncbi:MAG TPA: Ig-like domain-containing protein [Candidatus Dormibacteraeota bacterium]|nr:Ig-like domain-containing protein [Candidatus Dormibacteraeota bacterium]